LHPKVGNTDDNAASVDVCPSGGRLAMFWADETPHEVLPCAGGPRHAVTLWFYDTIERRRCDVYTDEMGQIRNATH
jgi:hypothetical protein